MKAMRAIVRTSFRHSSESWNLFAFKEVGFQLSLE